MTVLDLPDATSSDGTSVLSWLQSVADRNQPDDLAPTMIPVAWMGRTSTDDQQDPTLSLPRQLENTRRAATRSVGNRREVLRHRVRSQHKIHSLSSGESPNGR
jgi:hypothetical protein